MRLHVGGIRWGVRDEELRELFSAIGEVTSAEIVRDRVTLRSRGFGYVEMPNREEATRAIERLNGSEFRGLAIRVALALPRGSKWTAEERPQSEV